MKKFLYITVVSLALLGTVPQAFAANNVSQMAITEGGKRVAECARAMEKGVSECLNMPVCAE